MSTKVIDRKIAAFTTNIGKIKASGHEIAMLIFDHAHEHSDCTRAIKLCAAMPNSWQPQLEAWFKAFSPIRVVMKNSKCELSPEYKKATAENKADFWDRESALATPFYEIMDEPKVDKEYDFAALVQMVQRVGTQIKKKMDDGKVKPDDMLSAESIVTTLSGLNFKQVKAVEPQAPANEAGDPDQDAGGEELLRAVG